jgi:hypothetical protein
MLARMSLEPLSEAKRLPGEEAVKEAEDTLR